MAIVNKKYRYVFLAEKHCASRILRDVLSQHPGSEIVPPHHATLEELTAICPALRENPDDFFVFSVVRNPADILVTMHFANSFQEYLRTVNLNPTHTFFQHVEDGSVELRYENLERELNTVLETLGAPKVSIPRKEEYVTGGKNPWPAYYEKEDIDHIIRSFPEIMRWGYAGIIRQEWEEWQSQMRTGNSSS